MRFFGVGMEAFLGRWGCAVRVGGAETRHSNEVQSDTTGWIGTLEHTWYVGHYFSYLPNTPKSMQPTYQPVGSPCSLSYLKGSRVWREKDPPWMDRSSRPNSMSDSLFVLAKQFPLMMLADGGGGERGLSSALSHSCIVFHRCSSPPPPCRMAIYLFRSPPPSAERGTWTDSSKTISALPSL